MSKYAGAGLAAARSRIGRNNGIKVRFPWLIENISGAKRGRLRDPLLPDIGALERQE